MQMKRHVLLGHKSFGFRLKVTSFPEYFDGKVCETKSIEIIFLSLLRCLVLTYNVTMNAHQISIYIRTTECVLLFLIDSRFGCHSWAVKAQKIETESAEFKAAKAHISRRSCEYVRLA